MQADVHASMVMGTCKYCVTFNVRTAEESLKHPRSNQPPGGAGTTTLGFTEGVVEPEA